jgi:RNA polymerase sigma-70 factor (sigma-E family)
LGVDRFGHHRVAEAIILDRVEGRRADRWGAWAPDLVTPEAGDASRAAAVPPIAPRDVPTRDAVGALFEAHYTRLVHLARHLLDEPASAEDVVMDAFASLTGRWLEIRDYDAALGYLRSCVVFGSRSKLRRLIVARRHAAAEAPAATVAPPDQVVLDRLELADVAAAVRLLPTRQRQCLVLRYYEELSVAEVSDLLGCSAGSVKTHTSRALSRLSAALGGRR